MYLLIKYKKEHYKRDIDGRKGVCYDNLNKRDKATVDELKGPCLNSMSPQSKYAKEILRIISGFVITDKMYIERLKKHYARFKIKIKRIHKQDAE